MPTVLCVDDDPLVLQLDQVILERNGYEVLLASDGRTAVALASQNTPDLIVLDFRMQDMDGEEVAVALWRQRPELPIIVCSGYFDAIPEWLKWFAAACVEKGEGPEALLSAIRASLATTTPQSDAA